MRIATGCFLTLLVLILVSCTGASQTRESAPVSTPDPTIREYTFIQTITTSDENSLTIIRKNKLSKTATLEMHLFQERDAEVESSFDMRELSTLMTCGFVGMALFNETALEEFERAIDAWNLENANVSDDSPPDDENLTVGNNPLEGFTVSKAVVSLGYKGEGPFSECTITGYGEENIKIERYYEIPQE